MQTSCTKRRALEESSIRPTCSKLFERIAWGREGGREIETSQDGFVFLSPPLVSKKTNLMRQESRSLSRDNRRPSRRLLPPLISSPPRLWRASHTRRVEFVSRRLFPRGSPRFGEFIQREGVEERELESLGDTNSSVPNRYGLPFVLAYWPNFNPVNFSTHW